MPATKLLNLAGPNTPIDPLAKERVYRNVQQQWVERKARLQRRRWYVPTALAASLALISVVVLGNRPVTEIAYQPIASIEFVVPPTRDVFQVGQEISVGDVLDVPDGGGVAIALLDNTSIRLDGGTVLRARAKDKFDLISGRVYVDSGDFYSTGQVEIATASGVATDIGTQFLVEFHEADMTVAVREGQVDIADGPSSFSVLPGEQLTLRPGAPPARDTVSLSGQDWRWAIALGPAYDIDGQSVLEYLKWVSRESGLQLEFVDNDLRMAAMSVELQGSYEGLMPLESLESVLSTTRFRFDLDDQTLRIIRRAELRYHGACAG